MRLHAEINVTPLIDVLLVLLIIFMAAMNLTQQGLDTMLPEPATPDAPSAPPTSIVVEYTASRELFLNRQALTIEELPARLQSVFSPRRDKTLFIMGDGTLRYREIVAVIDAAKGAGVDRVGIVTERMRTGTGAR